MAQFLAFGLFRGFIGPWVGWMVCVAFLVPLRLIAGLLRPAVVRDFTGILFPGFAAVRGLPDLGGLLRGLGPELDPQIIAPRPPHGLRRGWTGALYVALCGCLCVVMLTEQRRFLSGRLNRFNHTTKPGAVTIMRWINLDKSGLVFG